MKDIRFDIGIYSACEFRHYGIHLVCSVHGDDFTFEGPARALASLPGELRQCWLIKVRGLLGPDKSDDKEISILNRVLR